MNNIESPCIEVCELTDQGLCRGCLRTSQEIATWISMSPEQRQSVIQSLESRKPIKETV